MTLDKNNRKLGVFDTASTVVGLLDQDYISLTDMLNAEDNDFIISDWLNNRNTVEFLGIWESVHNPDFNDSEFAIIKSQAGLNSSIISVKEWVAKTGSIGLMTKAGRNGGTYAHPDLALEFASWLSPVFKIYFMQELQHLKNAEQQQLGWDTRRCLAKINYWLHTDAIKENLIPPELSSRHVNQVYAMEADVLNMALFGMSAKQWCNANSDKQGNIRDDANISQLVCLTNLENLSAVFINEGRSQSERLTRLNQIAITQMNILVADHRAGRLEKSAKSDS
ncbi:KilA-N domain-containing protein [Alkalimonas sp. MEB108]|uniref:KilA-N domain-containing protein n=1 Tax=Alkalimonas cellulosilytica TaxID=3058395 RepID=A0ABU7J6H6_9GAMM|nr:KilA-N domain-containing protein [Alkalimonas sp. MEB108]MEE2002125.1 KilA-N domain-containing protein [Alkalimonas sp. MEB108]